MKFALIEASVKKQIKASMKRIAQKLIKLNVEKADKLDFITAFNIWASRYINTLHENKYYNLIAVDEELFEDLHSVMESVFSKEIDNLSVDTEPSEVKYPKHFIEKPASDKQIHYARYLMNMIKNEALPNKRYTMYEMNMLINDLKSKMKTV